MSWTVDRITAKCTEFSTMVGDTYDCPITLNGRLSRTLGRVIMTEDQGRVKPIKMEFSKEFLNTSTDASIVSVIGHEWAHYYITKTTGINHEHDQEFKKTCALIGCTNDKAKTEVERTVEPEALYKYIVYCPDCNSTIGMYKRMCPTLRNIDSCSCGLCGGQNLIVNQNY